MYSGCFMLIDVNLYVSKLLGGGGGADGFTHILRKFSVVAKKPFDSW